MKLIYDGARLVVAILEGEEIGRVVDALQFSLMGNGDLDAETANADERQEYERLVEPTDGAPTRTLSY